MGDKSYYSQVRKILVLVLFLNIGVALAKLGYGWYSNTLSMVSDGFHSLFDGASNIIAIVGIMIAARPPDIRHPYGHSKYETFAAIGIAVLLFITCFEIFQSALDRFYNPSVPEISLVSFLVMIITVVINWGVSRYENSKGRELGSNVLVADSMHTRSDIYASLMVIAGFIVIQLGFPIVDPIISLIIAILIAKMGVEIIKESSGVLLDQAPLSAEAICNIARQVEGVKGCHNARSRGTPREVYVDLHIILDDCFTLDEAHRISHKVEQQLMDSLPGVQDVVVHVDPCPTH